MRPGDGSLFLNVNTVTSAFFSPINLQEWIKHCWKNRMLSGKDFVSTLKDVRVTLDPHKESRIWVICGISPQLLSKEAFEDDEVKKVKVLDYPKKSERCIISFCPTNSLNSPPEYASHGWKPADANAFCINVGSNSQPVWFPANKLTIVDWQVVREECRAPILSG